MSTRWSALGLVMLACSNRAAPRVDAGTGTARVTLAGGTLAGGPRADVVFEGRFVVEGPAQGTIIDVSGKYLVPAFIDSHVHLSYFPVAAELAENGVVAAIDMAAPRAALGEPATALLVLRAGPMITAVGGYPTRSWGSDGYGLEVASVDEARQAVDTLHEAGAQLIKLALTSAPSLDLELASAVVERARELGLKVTAHALEASTAALAADAGVDLLAHTPTETLPAETIQAFEGRAVVSTLGAFGGGASAVENLSQLRSASVRVLYGTDLGNTRTVGIQADEIALLRSAGLTPSEIIAAGTSEPAAYWNLAELGAIAPGKRASVLVLARDPLLDPSVLATPDDVYLDGERVGP
jgi:imidazolonepropionase-like amidohydrolase